MKTVLILILVGITLFFLIKNIIKNNAIRNYEYLISKFFEFQNDIWNKVKSDTLTEEEIKDIKFMVNIAKIEFENTLSIASYYNINGSEYSEEIEDIKNNFSLIDSKLC